MNVTVYALPVPVKSASVAASVSVIVAVITPVVSASIKLAFATDVFPVTVAM